MDSQHKFILLVAELRASGLITEDMHNGIKSAYMDALIEACQNTRTVAINECIRAIRNIPE